MLNKLFKMLTLVVCMTFIILLPTLTGAANISDNHNDGTLTGWTVNGSRTWSESSGQVLPANGNSNAGFLINNTTVGANGTLEIRMTTDQWNGFRGGVVLRWTSATSYYYVAVLPGNQYNNYISFCKNSMDAATGVKIAQNFAIGTTFVLKIEMNGNTFKFYTDGVLRGQVTDNTNLSGKIGYGYSTEWNRYTSYDNITWTETTTQYTLTTTAVGQGTVTPASGSYTSGTIVSLTATAAAGWHFDHWSGDVTGTNSSAPVTMSANRNVTATFVQNPVSYTLTTTAVGQGTVTPASGSYTSGTVVSLTATAAAGWRFDHWSGALTGTINPASVTIDTNKNITATFVQNPVSYTLTTTAVGQGTVTPASGSYISGTVVSLTATAAAGWHFDHWSGALTGTTNPASVTIDTDKNITATFVQNPVSYTLTTTVVGQGTVTPASGSYTSGTIVSLTATAAAGWHFDHWSGALTGTTNPASVTIDTNKNITATFVQDTVSYTLTTTVVGQGTVTPSSGSYTSGTVVILTATAAVGWHFDHWSGALTGTTNPASVIIDTNKNITAAFVQDTVSYTLTTTVVGQGTVTPDSGSYASGTVVSLTATASAGWHFDHWSGALTGTTNPASVTIDTNKNITATFAPNPVLYTLTTTVVGQGTVTPSSGSYTSGTVVILTATAAVGWHFDHWSGALTGTTNPASVTVDTNKNITATFVQNPVSYTLTTTAVGQGTVTPDSGSYASGTVVSLTATAAVGWHFDHWSGALTGTTNPASVTMNANKSITATFIVDARLPNREMLSVSARLLRADGTPVGNDLAVQTDMIIKLYDQETGGELIYTESFLNANQRAPFVDRGYFAVRLGEGITTDNLQQVISEGNNLWIEISVDANIFTQRIPLTAAPYSISSTAK